MSLELYPYVAACLVVAVVPGPAVAMVVANSMTHGVRAGLMNVAGTQVGLLLMLGTLLVGLASVIEGLGWWFDWLRLAGAAYLVWLGWKLFRFSGSFEHAGSVPKPRLGFFLQGLLVMLSNPKVLLFFGAFIPQFVDPGGDPDRQVAILGATAMLVAMLSDGAYAVLAGRAGAALSRQRMRLVAKGSGLCLIGGGVWLALGRTR